MLKIISRHPVASLGLLLTLLLSPGLFWGMSSILLPEIDTDMPLGALFFFVHWNDPTAVTVYPAMQKMLLFPIHALIAGTLFLTGHYAPDSQTSAGDTLSLITALTLTARLLTLMMGVSMILVFYHLARLFASRAAACWAALLLATSPIVAFYSRTGNLDIPQLFWWSISFYALWQVILARQPSRLWLLVCGAASGFAVATKDQAVFFALSNGMTLLAVSAGDLPLRRRIKRLFPFLFAAAAAYLCLAVLPHPLRWLHHIGWIMPGSETVGENFVEFAPTLAGYGALMQKTAEMLARILSFPVLLMGVAGYLLLLVRRDWAKLTFLLLPPLLFVLLMVVPLRFIHERYALNAALPILLAAAFALQALLVRAGSHKGRISVQALAGAFIVVQISTGYLPLTVAQSFDTKRRLDREIGSFVPPGSPVAWEGRIYHFVNGSTSNRYRFVIPDSVLHHRGWDRLAGVFHPFDDSYRYVLADNDLFQSGGRIGVQRRWIDPPWVDTAGLVLVKSFRHAAWVERGSSVYASAHRAGTFLVSHRYYLYRRKKTKEMVSLSGTHRDRVSWVEIKRKINLH